MKRKRPLGRRTLTVSDVRELRQWQRESGLEAWAFSHLAAEQFTAAGYQIRPSAIYEAVLRQSWAWVT